MQQRIALCVDETTRQNPQIIGLDAEAIGAHDWLEVYSSGAEARAELLANRDIDHAWVISCDDVDPINLAATLKSDRPELRVALVASEGCGSLFSRAHTAQIDEVIDLSSFPSAYAKIKNSVSSALAATPVAASNESAPSPDPIATPSKTLELPEIGIVGQSSETKQAQTAFIMPIVSGSGGAGKSTVAVTSALIAGKMGYRTALLDYDLQFGDMSVLSGIANALPIDTAIDHPDQLEQELARGSNLTVFAAPSRLEAAEAVVQSMPGFIERISQSFEVIIANTGAAWAEQHAVLLERSSAALFLVDQRASSLRACTHALELCARCGIATGPFTFAVNRCAKNTPLSAADVSCALDGVSVFELKDGGRDVEDYLGSGNGEDLLALRNDFCTSLERLLTQVLPGAKSRSASPLSAPEERRSFLRRTRHSDRKRGRSES